MLAAALAATAVGELIVGREQVEGPWWGELLAFLVMTGAVALRRRTVILAAAACGSGLVVQEMLGPAPVVSGFLALLVVVYSGGAHGAARQGVAALIVMLAALTVYPVTEPAARGPRRLGRQPSGIRRRLGTRPAGSPPPAAGDGPGDSACSIGCEPGA